MRPYKLFRERTEEDHAIDKIDIENGKNIPTQPLEPHVPFKDRPGRNKDMRLSHWPQQP